MRAVKTAALPMVSTKVTATVPAQPRCGVMPASPSQVRTRLMKSTWLRKMPPVRPARYSAEKNLGTLPGRRTLCRHHIHAPHSSAATAAVNQRKATGW